jgi:hypothetical protein
MATFSYVQSAISVSATTSLAFAANVTAGNILFAYLGSFSGTIPATLTDSQGTTWHPVPNSGTSGYIAGLYCAVAASTGACTVSYSGATGGLGCIILEYSAASPYCVVAVNSAGGGGNPFVVSSGQSLSIPSGVEYLALSFMWDDHTGHAVTSSPATIRQQSGSVTGGETIAVADQDVASGAIGFASPYQNTFTGPSGVYVGGVAILIAVSGGGGGGSTTHSFVFG